MSSIQIRANKAPTNIDKVLGFDKYQEGKFPGTKTVIIPFKQMNGQYRHGVTNETDRQFIEDKFFGGQSLESEVAKEYYRTCSVELNPDITFFDTENPESLLKFYIAVSAEEIVAKSRADAKSKSMSVRPFIVEDGVEVKKEQLSVRQKVNKARAKLAELETEPTYMVVLAKYLAPSNAGITNEQNAYIYLDDLLTGKYTDDSELVAVNRFNQALSVDKEILYVASDVKEAIYKNVIRKQGGVFTNPISQTPYGRTEEEVVNFLSQDMNQEELGTGTPLDKPYSVRFQLKNRK